MTRLIHFLMGPVLFICGILVFNMGQQQASVRRAMDNHGKTADADVLRIFDTQQNTMHTYSAEVEFITADRQKMTLRVSIPATLAKSLTAANGGEVTVRYLPEDPNQIELADKPIEPNTTRMAGIAIVIAGVIVSWWKIFRRES